VTIDPLPSDTPAPEPERDREARVEELLLNGLDHYFVGQYELAINVWTRALFLDRGHARARAYIERARGAVAERQREGEELIQSGAAAFQRGESAAARRLLTSAVEHGAATEEALTLLERLDRLEAASGQQDTRASRPAVRHDKAPGTEAETRRDRSWLGWIAAGIVLGAAAVAVAAAVVWVRGEWRPIAGAATAATRPIDQPLPVPSASDVRLARARAQYERGHLREALVEIEAVPPGDPRSADADALKADIQAKLLQAAQ
jgi:tetratricopeptide (TPR) repeat protein